MRAKNYSVLMIGLLALGFLIVNHALPWEPVDAQAAGEPVIQFVSPAGTPRYTRTSNPIVPAIVIDVEVDFPVASSPCAGAPLPVDRETLEVTLHRQIDGASQESWDVDEGTWTWDPVEDTVTGQVTIGGPDSGQDRSFYGIRVCIDNDSASACATKGIRVEYPVSGFTAGLYATKGTSFGQNPGCTLIPAIALPLINGQMAATEFLTIVPSAAEITPPATADVNFIGIPLIGSIDMPASLNGGDNQVDLAEVAVSGIDLSGIGFPGTSCEISGKADGTLMGEVSPGQDLDGSIRVYDISLSVVPPGSCTLVAEPGCELLIKFDGNVP